MTMTPVPYRSWTAFTPVIPKFYWDVYSQEERIKAICEWFDKLEQYCNYLAGLLETAATDEELEAVADDVDALEDAIDAIQDDIEELTTALAGKQDTLPTGTNDTYLHKNASTGALEWSTVSTGGTWGSITGTLSNQTDLQEELDDLQDDIEELTTALAGKQDTLPTGTNDTYLHKNASTGALEWSTVSTGVTWGSITGTLSNQTDLQEELDDLQDAIDGKQATISDLATIRTNATAGANASASVFDSTATDGQVLTSNGDGTVSYETIEIDETNIASESQDSGKVLTADGQGGCAWQYPSASNFNSTGATSGQVLTANSSGGAAWGNTSVAGTAVTSTGATSGQVLTADGNGGAAWGSLPNNATFSLSGTTLTITNS